MRLHKHIFRPEIERHSGAKQIIVEIDHVMRPERRNVQNIARDESGLLVNLESK